MRCFKPIAERVKRFYKRWLRLGKKIAVLQVRIMFTAAYFLFIVPFGFFSRIFSRPYKSGWVDTGGSSNKIEEAKRQF